MSEEGDPNPNPFPSEGEEGPTSEPETGIPPPPPEHQDQDQAEQEHDQEVKERGIYFQDDFDEDAEGMAEELDQLQLEDLEELSPEEMEAEEAEFRAKYALDLPEEGEDGEDEEEEDINKLLAEEAEEAEEDPTEEQMDAIIEFLKGEEEDESEEEQDEDEEEEEEEQESETKKDPKHAQLPQASENVMVLGPDHPKMARFQRALKEHLQRQIYLANLELTEMENELKMKTKERTDLGTALYNLQHEILRQSESIEKYEKEATKMREKREKVEEKTKELRATVLMLRQECLQEEEREFGLRDSLKTLDYTENVVRQAAQKYDGELKIRQLVGEKLEKLRSKAELEKKEQDFYLDKVLSHVQHMELINAGIERQIQAHREEQVQLNTYITEAVTEIDALQIEKLHLQRAWNETISVVRARDDAITAARQTLLRVSEDIRIRESELRSIGRLIVKEQEGHERAIILLRRRKMEEKVLKRQLQRMEDENDGLKERLGELSQLRRQVEAQLLQANNVHSRKNREALAPRRQIEALMQEKNRLEDQILNIVQEQGGLSNATSHLQALIREARGKTRAMEIDVTKVENENALMAVEVERLRAEAFKKSAELKELEKRCSDQEKILNEQLRDITQSERIIQKKTTEVGKLKKKLEKMLQKQGGVEMGPLEFEIQDLERQIVSEKDECDKLQEDWLKRQDDLVKLSTHRDYLVHHNELLRKELFVMERKRQRLDSEVEQKKSKIGKIKKSTEAVMAEIAAINAKLHEDRNNHDQMDKDNILIQNELVALLKDAEMEAIEIEREIEALDEEKLNLIQQLHQVHEENLQWEKKVKLAKELKDNLKKEQEGSNSALKLDIHHMQVRFNELVRAQEKLMSDLERSIERRDRIIQQADIALHRDKKNQKQSKLNIQRNLSSIRDKNRLLTREANEIEQQVKDMMENISEIEDKWNGSTDDLNKVKETIQASEEKIAEASVQKHKNLVDIVLRQEKFRILESIKHNRYKPSGKSVEEIQKMLEEAEKDCYAVINLVDQMEEQFPEAGSHLKLVKASILPSSS